MSNIGELKIGVSFTRCDECQYRRDTSLRDDLLVTAGARAAYMDGVSITLSNTIAGEGELARFIFKAVDYYIATNPDEPFDTYIETALIDKYGYKEDKDAT